MLSRLTRTGRLFAPVCVIFAAAAIALVAPSAASAGVRFAKCSEGKPVDGEGSTLQALAQKEVWGNGAPHAFNNAGQKNKAACPVGGPTITYNDDGKTGSGKGMENWQTPLDEFGPEDQGFVGTDNPPDKTIQENIEKEGTKGVGGGKLLTIPVLQASIAILINLPEKCTATSTAKPGRLVLGAKTTEGIFRRKIKKWSQIKDGGDKLEGTGCVSTTEITRVVREDGSGTTATFKKSLELINSKNEKAVNGKTWLESAQEPPPNTEWPEEKVKLLRGNGNGGVVGLAAETPSSVAYANLADARVKTGSKTAGGFVPSNGGGPGTQRFWAPVENGKKVGTEKVFADPATNGDENAKGNANCEATAYVAINAETGKAEKGKFPPVSAEALWNLASAEKIETNYPLCGLTYDLSLTDYAGFTGHGATEAEATTVGDYLQWVLNTEAEGGQALINESHDYLALPNTGAKGKNVLVIAQEGAKKIGF